MGPDSLTISIRTGRSGIRAPQKSQDCIGQGSRRSRAIGSAEVMRAVILAMVGDEGRIEVGIRSGRRALVRLEVDRADERIVAADLAQVLHATEPAVGLAGGGAPGRRARRLASAP